MPTFSRLPGLHSGLPSGCSPCLFDLIRVRDALVLSLIHLIILIMSFSGITSSVILFLSRVVCLIWGECVLTVDLCDEAPVEGEQELEFFLSFTGSDQRHLTSTLKLSHGVLQTVCPAHNCCELVLVSLHSLGLDGGLHTVASQHLCFVQDLVFDMAQFLISSVGQRDVLEEALLLDEHQIPLQECENLDRGLSLALRHFTLPPGWSLMGNNTALEPQETLLHFAARRGLLKVASFLLQQPGAREALCLCNKQGLTPELIAANRGHTMLVQLFRQVDLQTDADIEKDVKTSTFSDSRVLQHFPNLNTYALSVGMELGGEEHSLLSEILELHRQILCHHREKGGATFRESLESLHITQECDDDLESRSGCCDEALHDSLVTRARGFTHLSTEENNGAQNDSLDSSQTRECDGDPSLSPETAQSLLHNEDQRVCFCKNREADLRRQEESSNPAPVYICDSSDGVQSVVDRISSCGCQKEEADEVNNLILEVLVRSEVPQRELGEKVLEKCEERDMGIRLSLETPESSDVESSSSLGAETDDEAEEGPDFIEESKDLLCTNPGDMSLNLLENEICSNRDDRENQMMVEIKREVCTKLETSQDGPFEDEESSEEFQETLETPYLETSDQQQFGNTTHRTTHKRQLATCVTSGCISGWTTNEQERRPAGRMYERYKRRYSLCARGETAVDVVLIKIQRDKDAVCSSVSQKRLSLSTESSCFPKLRTCGSEVLAFRDSGSETDGFLSPDVGQENFFGKDAVAAGDSTSEVSVCSSTDDTASIGHPSSSADSSEEVQRAGETEDEAKDRLTETLLPSALFRSGIRSLSPFRRHSWGPGKNQQGDKEMNQRSFSLEGLAAGMEDRKSWPVGSSSSEKQGSHHQKSEERGSLRSLTEEELQSDQRGSTSPSAQKSRKHHHFRHSGSSLTLPLTKSVSMLSISQRDMDAIGRIRRKRRISFTFNLSPILPKSKSLLTETSSSSDEEDIMSMTYRSHLTSMGYSISEEEPGPLRGDFEKSSTKVGRTFSYLKNKMYKKAREKDKEKLREKDREAQERDRKSVNGHLFHSLNPLHPALCQQCNKTLNIKDALSCTSCNVRVHKACRESLPICPMNRIKPCAIPESTAMPAVTLRTKSSTLRERPWSAIFSPEEHSAILPSRRPISIMPFHSSNLSKSMSINNIAMYDDRPLSGRRYLSQSTDSLHKHNKVTASTESLDEGTELIDSRLMGEFEAEMKELEADSWSLTVDKKHLKQLKKEVIKRQDVIYGAVEHFLSPAQFSCNLNENAFDAASYVIKFLTPLFSFMTAELIQTEMHHLRTLRIMSDVYNKGLLCELQLELQALEKMFPMLEELLELHGGFFNALLERRREAQEKGAEPFLIHRIGDLLLSQFSDSSAESMKRVYSKFCSRHNEAVNFYKDLHSRDRRFQAFIRKKMSCSVVRRLSIPECILLVTQRITKYPVLLQRILQHTKENEADFEDLTQALRLVKDIIAAVDSKVNDHEKKKRLKEIYGRTDNKSITRMKSGQMFAREDLLRSRKLLHDGPLQLKNSAGRLKDVHALLLSDVIVFLQEKDQKYVFASLDQRATVLSLQKLIVREVAHEERGLFLITAGIANPEMLEVHGSSREERNNWMQLIQDAMHSGETEEDRKLLESKSKEMREMLQRKDEQIGSLLMEKMKIFREMCGSSEDTPMKILFRANNEDVPRGEPIMVDALREVETLQALVNSSLGGAVAGQQVVCEQGNMGNVCLPRRAETFGGFDSHQMNTCKHGEKEEAEDLRRTESDSVLKKGGNGNLLLLFKRNSQEVLTSVTHLHDLLTSLQVVVLQQDTFIEDQRQALSERTPSRSSSSRPLSSSSSLLEQEKHRILERQRQEAAALQRQQAVHAEEKRRKEKEWDVKERQLTDREVLLHVREEEMHRRSQELQDAQHQFLARKEDYQRDLERLRDAQRRLEREREQLQKDNERVQQLREVEARLQRSPSSTSEDSLKLHSSSSSMEREVWESELSSSPRKNSLSRMDSKQKARSLFSLSGKTPSIDGQNQIPSRLLQLATSREKKDKKKKKTKGQTPQDADTHLLPLTEPPVDGEIFFC
ncbi:hypothetical protein DNTS_030589 [Danionella cerebrum]|uniref:Uncharacterized protein n=1 Tax=Danionella cerebrum TaxID=2873325 RepID=A0A553PY64_9TELE|nr:hypothetical protein DNTS_030589 [Danionella translucida]